MIAVLFPGQGSQRAGMLRDVAALPSGAATVAEACGVLARDLSADDGDALMRSTAAAQRALLVSGVASMRALEDAGIAVDAVAGHSVGAFAAAVACGALVFADALRAVDVRGTAMADAFPDGFGMVAVGGLDERVVADIARAVGRAGDEVYAANVNAPDQIVLAGRRPALERAIDAADRRGARVTRLAVPVPAHTPLLDSVAAKLDVLFATLHVRDARIFYATNTSGRTVRDGVTIGRDLIESVARPVRWADAVRALYERGVRLFIEARPGTILTDLAARAYPDARCVALETSTLETVATLSAKSRGDG